jgi:hypothetical protein
MDFHFPLSINEQVPFGANAVAVLTHEDLTESADNTAQVIALFTAPAGKAIRYIGHKLVRAFKDASDAAFNTTPITAGDAGDPDRLLVSTELSENGTEIVRGYAMAAPALPATVSTADGSDAGTTQALANALKVSHNALLAALKGGPAYVYASDTAVNVTVGSMADKALEDVDTGEVLLYFHIGD